MSIANPEIKNIGHITRLNAKMMCPTFILSLPPWGKVSAKLTDEGISPQKPYAVSNYLLASSIATATATVIPTMGLLPAPISPIISTLERELYEKSLMCHAKSNT